jgi:hypothetical protein
MRHISRITVSNFQSHEDSTIELPGPGTLTVVTGASDSGKTALVSRALRWLFLNQPQGDSFIRSGATAAKVTVEYDDGWLVERERTPSRNQYHIYLPDADEPQVFEGFGSSVPLEVQQVAGVAPVRIGDLDLTLNLSSQLESAFLGSSISSTARARVLGVLAGTEAIDQAAKDVGTDLHRARRDETRLEGELTTIQQGIDQLSWVEPMGALLDAAAIVVDKLRAATSKLERIEQLLLRRHELGGRVGQCRDRVEVCNRILAAKRSLQLASELSRRYSTIVSLSARHAGVQSLMQKQQTVLTRCAAMLKASPYVAGAREYTQRYDRLHVLAAARTAQMQSMYDASAVLHTAQAQLQARDPVTQATTKMDSLIRLRHLIYKRRTVLESLGEEQRRAQALSKRTQMAIEAREAYLAALGRCPTCGQTISVSA